ncbi:MAG: hypothetical protein AAFV53_02070 [Myxococcota bacterium]
MSLKETLAAVHDRYPARAEGLRALQRMPRGDQVALLDELFRPEGVETLIEMVNASPRRTTVTPRRLSKWFRDVTATIPDDAHAPDVVLDALYWAEPSARVRHPLRFFSDGLTMEVYVSGGTVEQVAKWFTAPDPDNFASTSGEMGLWAQRGRRVYGFWSATWGIRPFLGAIRDDGSLTLTACNLLSAKKRAKTYRRLDGR